MVPLYEWRSELSGESDQSGESELSLESELAGAAEATADEVINWSRYDELNWASAKNPRFTVCSTPVQYQGPSSACWIFASIAAYEVAMNVQTIKPNCPNQKYSELAFLGKRQHATSSSGGAAVRCLTVAPRSMLRCLL